MREMMKSKTIILFIVMMVGITFVSSHQAKLEDRNSIENDYLVYNLK